MKLKITKHVWFVVFLIYKKKKKKRRKKERKEKRERKKERNTSEIPIFKTFIAKSEFSDSAMLYDVIAM